MSEDIPSDNEDTISVPVPDQKAIEATEEKDVEVEKMTRDMADVHAVMETLERTLTVAMAAFEELKRVVFGEEETVVHACPPGSSGLMPCCGRNPMDVPLTERISLDGTMVTCKGFPR